MKLFFSYFFPLNVVLLVGHKFCDSIIHYFCPKSRQNGDFMKRILDNNEQLNIIGSRIRDARIAAGYSQQTLSAKLELMAVYVCRGSLSRIETGDRAVTDIEIDAISKVLNVSLDYLFGRE